MKWNWASQITGKASCWIWSDKGKTETGENWSSQQNLP